MELYIYSQETLNYSRLPITRTFKGNRKRFELLGVRVIRRSRKIAESKVKFVLHGEHFNHIYHDRIVEMLSENSKILIKIINQNVK